MKKTVIIVAAGLGSRISSQTPKQFIPINGVPMLAYSIKAFHNYNAEIDIVIALHSDFVDEWNILSKETHVNNIPVKIVTGGKERFYSVSNALNVLKHNDGLVAVHDAARPFVSQLLIEKLFSHAERTGCAVPALPIKDSLRTHVMGEWIVADRNSFRAIQTPQVFDIEKLKASYQQSYQPKFTDDATVYEAAGHKIYLVDGDEDNLKITTDKDLGYAEFFATKQGW